MNRMLLITLLLVSASAARAEIYRWQDENGQVHFSERPPSGQSSQVVEVEIQNRYEPVTPVPPPASTDWRAREQQSRDDRRQQRLRAEEEERRRQKRQQQCENARSHERSMRQNLHRNTSLAELQAHRQRRDKVRDRVERYCR